MDVIHEKGQQRGAFKIKDNGKTIAAMTYVHSGEDTIIIDHTQVATLYQGQGLGEKMVKSAVNYARENHITIVPLCSFARQQFKKYESYNDVKKQK